MAKNRRRSKAKQPAKNWLLSFAKFKRKKLKRAAKAIKNIRKSLAVYPLILKPNTTHFSGRPSKKNLLKKNFPLSLPHILQKELRLGFNLPKHTAIPKRPRQLARIPLPFKRELVVTFRPSRKTGRRAQPKRILIPLRPRTVLAVILLMAGMAGSLFFGRQIIYSNPSGGVYNPPAPEIIQQTEAPKSRDLTRSAPQRLRVESIGLDTAFIELGRQADGTMEVPERYDIAGWYKYAPTPGEIGPAVIAGHLDSYKGPAVFYRLKELQPGQIIEVTRSDGTVVKFKIDAVRQFPQDNFPTKEVYGNIPYAGLRLITCGGNFNRLSRQYDQNTVVYAAMLN